jgi:hypothetical protein
MVQHPEPHARLRRPPLIVVAAGVGLLVICGLLLTDTTSWGCAEAVELVFLLGLRLWLLATTGWGMWTMRRLLLRGKQLEFPIVPPPLVRLTAGFLTVNFATTLWITGELLIGDNRLCAPGAGPVGALNEWERAIYGGTLVYSLTCAIWIIHEGIRGYRQGPKVDLAVLDAIVEGMHDNDRIGPHDGAPT